jgi:hypothetical protein
MRRVGVPARGTVNVTAARRPRHAPRDATCGRASTSEGRRYPDGAPKARVNGQRRPIPVVPNAGYGLRARPWPAPGRAGFPAVTVSGERSHFPRAAAAVLHRCAHNISGLRPVPPGAGDFFHALRTAHHATPLCALFNPLPDANDPRPRAKGRLSFTPPPLVERFPLTALLLRERGAGRPRDEVRSRTSLPFLRQNDDGHIEHVYLARSWNGCTTAWAPPVYLYVLQHGSRSSLWYSAHYYRKAVAMSCCSVSNFACCSEEAP